MIHQLVGLPGAVFFSPKDPGITALDDICSQAAFHRMLSELILDASNGKQLCVW